MNRVQMMEQYERVIGKPGTEWGSQEIEGFFQYIRSKKTKKPRR